MRTTLTLDPDVVRLLEQETHRQRRPFKRVVNEALRKGLTRTTQPAHKVRLVGYDSCLMPGFDAARLNALADELEDDAVVTQLRASASAASRQTAPKLNRRKSKVRRR
jgi:hypothetical protein